MVVSTEIGILAALVLAVCLIGFKKYVWFISIGYGLSVFIIGAGLLFMLGGEPNLVSIIWCVVLMCFGLRLGGYLTIRERNSAYQNKMKGEISDGSHMPFVAKIALWISCALLYLCMCAPVIYRVTNHASGDVCAIVGAIVSVAGIVLEASSDLQKSRAKKENPRRFCDTGLFKIVRCPNYLGELLIWTGVLISAFTADLSVGQWIVSIIGYVGIVYVMFSGARRLEIRHDKHYGDDPEYIAYKERTPIIIPLVPLYSVKKHTWLVG